MIPEELYNLLIYMESKRKHNTKGKGVERIDKQYPDIMIENDQDEELIQQIMDEFDQKDSNESNKQSSTKENASSKQQNSNKGKDLTPSKAKGKIK